MSLLNRCAAMAIFIALALAGVPANAQETDTAPDAKGRSSEDIYSGLRLFGEVFDRIRSQSVDVPDGHEELKRTNALLEQQLSVLGSERDSLRSRLAAARARIDALIERLPAGSDVDGGTA
jgi:hypothetical protein